MRSLPPRRKHGGIIVVFVRQIVSHREDGSHPAVPDEGSHLEAQFHDFAGIEVLVQLGEDVIFLTVNSSLTRR